MSVFADDTSVFISKNNYDDFKEAFILVLSLISKWFHANQLILNVEKNKYTKVYFKVFILSIRFEYAGKLLIEVTNLSFLGMHLNWKSHIHLILPKVYAACFALRRLFYDLNIDAVWILGFAYFRSMIKHGIIMGGNSTNTGQVFLSQKRIIRTIVGVGCTCLCRRLFRKLDILPVPCLCVFSLSMFVFNNLENFQTNSSVHGMNTRNKTH